MTLKGAYLFLLLFIGMSVTAQTIRLPYNDKGGWMLVDLKVNNTPMTFLFDTGWDGLAIRGSLLDRFHKAGAIDVVDANNIAQQVELIHVDSMKVGSYTFRDIPFTDLEKFPMLSDPIFDCYNIAGILGNVIYQDKILEIDPVKQEIILQDFNPELVDRLLAGGFTEVKNSNRSYTPRMVIPMKVNELERYFLLDTGDNSYLSMSVDPQVLQTLEPAQTHKYLTTGSVSAFGLNESLNYTLVSSGNTIKVGKQYFDNQEITFSLGENANQIGVEFIKQYHLVYFPDKATLFMKKVKQSTVISTLEKVGYGIAYVEGQYRIAAIGEKNRQVRLGDIVLALDGIPMDKLCNYRKYIQAKSTPPVLTVSRDEKQLTISPNGK
ncbi:aspartyl protease family protein [Myroides pelagicus]|uniref:aspartyl protease family protein n=1 Tax=Myroides pelagicus TaxID=270914 RepID=UPI002DBAC7B3|nr:aspartyl protease family protein [Myroides pelagicus]MEC4114807.1 aspartyl protease family protein [Myroides pelagicus]